LQKNNETKEIEAICECSNERRAVIVSVKMLDNMVDLFDVEYRECNYHDISDCVVHVMDAASSLHIIGLNEDLISRY
jgi:hypothetical protein